MRNLKFLDFSKNSCESLKSNLRFCSSNFCFISVGVRKSSLILDVFLLLPSVVFSVLSSKRFLKEGSNGMPLQAEQMYQHFASILHFERSLSLLSCLAHLLQQNCDVAPDIRKPGLYPLPPLNHSKQVLG